MININDENGEEMKDKDGKPFKLYTFFLNKHLNAKKLSSHMWFFEGFC